jgi:hypothetical protein
MELSTIVAPFSDAPSANGLACACVRVRHADELDACDARGAGCARRALAATTTRTQTQTQAAVTPLM